MTVQLPNLVPPLGAAVNIPVDVTAPVNITPYVAMQRVNTFVRFEISTQLRATTPVLHVSDRMCWSVPIELVSPVRGVIGRVGELLVDVETGEVLADGATVQRIASDLEDLAQRPLLRTRLPQEYTRFAPGVGTTGY